MNVSDCCLEKLVVKEKERGYNSLKTRQGREEVGTYVPNLGNTFIYMMCISNFSLIGWLKLLTFSLVTENCGILCDFKNNKGNSL